MTRSIPGSLRGHVGGRARAELLRPDIPNGARQAEVGDDNVPPAVEHDVSRLEITVQNAPGVRRGQAGAELPRDVEGLVLRNSPDAIEERAEVFAVHVLHSDEAVAVGLHNVVNATDVRTGDLPRDTDLAAQSGKPSRIVREDLWEELQRHRLIEDQIVGPVHLPHAALSEQGDDAIAACHDRAGRPGTGAAQGDDGVRLRREIGAARFRRMGDGGRTVLRELRRNGAGDVMPEKFLDARLKLRVPAAGAPEERGALLRRKRTRSQK